MFSIFKKNKQEVQPPKVDIHSHLLPGIDDGVQTIDESLNILRQYESLGYQKIITTPHIMSDLYPNTREIIIEKCNELKSKIKEEQMLIKLEVAAEYYFDEHFISLVENKKKLLTFGGQYILFEIGFIREPLNLKSIIFELITQGYKPVLAHPERYLFYHNEIDKLEDLVERGVYLQINLNSVTGYYSKEAKQIAEKLINKNLVSFVGSDCHNQRHFDQFKIALEHKSYRMLSNMELLNNTL